MVVKGEIINKQDIKVSLEIKFRYGELEALIKDLRESKCRSFAATGFIQNLEKYKNAIDDQINVE